MGAVRQSCHCEDERDRERKRERERERKKERKKERKNKINKERTIKAQETNK